MVSLRSRILLLWQGRRRKTYRVLQQLFDGQATVATKNPVTGPMATDCAKDTARYWML